jgi:hypothetical protein
MSKHFAKLRNLHKESTAALQVFLSTKERLEKTNAELDVVIDGIETEMSVLTTAWRDAKSKKAENAGIAAKIEEMIRA